MREYLPLIIVILVKMKQTNECKVMLNALFGNFELQEYNDDTNGAWWGMKIHFSCIARV